MFTPVFPKNATGISQVTTIPPSEELQFKLEETCNAISIPLATKLFSPEKVISKSYNRLPSTSWKFKWWQSTKSFS